MPVQVEMRDESAKIDINTASDALLRGLFVSAGLNDDDATALLDAMLDWRDADTLKRPHGAEEADYQSAGLPYRPANAPFQAIEELQLVLGMRPEIYRRIAPSITVFSRQAGVNPQLAAREVLLAIPGVTAEVVDDYIAQREDAARQRPAAALVPAGGRVCVGLLHGRVDPLGSAARRRHHLLARGRRAHAPAAAPARDVRRLARSRPRCRKRFPVPKPPPRPPPRRPSTDGRPRRARPARRRLARPPRRVLASGGPASWSASRSSASRRCGARRACRSSPSTAESSCWSSRAPP